ncbi:PepSY domain-containing protein [Alteraurantiacibacter aquimixticola]|uniref:PepSY domain-containing protein n=1 Tax=Alteraurantiacibacter aquimixticola TaxID=2489173 RepID=A0A4T3F3A8_9SPHN|nr:PepSY domain-containing protein [Alteraurantiacibacter aquimixticola]TIX51683.1 hypothetical protein E5222_04330 [Alteraurantiacibacter aquimixticola]
MWHRLKRWLYLTHRWMGIATCLLFVLWFVSGLVMLYVPFPSLEDEERLQGLTPIAWEQVEHGPYDAGREQDLREIVLEMRDGRPVWRLLPWDADPYAVWADSGLPTATVDRLEAQRIAEGFGKEPVSAMRRIYNDQWSVPGGYDVHRPLWKAELAGEEGRVLYVSSTSGEVILDTDAKERFWNWLGSIPHWLYPRALREEQPVWRQVVMWVSGPCILVALTGTWIGLMRLRAGKRRFKDGGMTPYRGWMKWHHVSGLVGSVFLILWVFSGWLSVDPFRLFASEGISAGAYREYAGTDRLPEPDLAELAQLGPVARQVVVRSAAGQAVLRIREPDLEDRVIDAAMLGALNVNEERIKIAAARLVPGAEISATETLTKPDSYWYAVRGEVPLPVLRLRFTDEAQTWVHIDPATGELLGQSDTRRRTYRWLFDLFHRWDLNLFLRASPSRDLLIWVMSIAGLISSVTAVYIGWVRLRRQRPRPQL